MRSPTRELDASFFFATKIFADWRSAFHRGLIIGCLLASFKLKFSRANQFRLYRIRSVVRLGYES
jgi:hypothetical protein